MNIILKSFKNIKNNLLKSIFISLILEISFFFFLFLIDNYIEDNPSLYENLRLLVISIFLIFTDYMLARLYLIYKKENNLKLFSIETLEILKLSFIKNVKIILWSILFILPGMYKYYEYKRVIYIKTYNMNLTTKECFEKSKKEMKGNKLKLFLYQIAIIAISVILSIILIITSVFCEEIIGISNYLPFEIMVLLIFVVMISTYLIFVISNLSLDATFSIEII